MHLTELWSLGESIGIVVAVDIFGRVRVLKESTACTEVWAVGID